jgi:hypothetical protein
MHAKGGVTFSIEFDFIDHRLKISTNRGEVDSFELVDGLSVAEFDTRLHAILAARGIDVAIREEGLGLCRFQIQRDLDGRHGWHVFNASGAMVGRHPEGFATELEARLDAEQHRELVAQAPIIGESGEGAPHTPSSR